VIACWRKVENICEKNEFDEVLIVWYFMNSEDYENLSKRG